MELLRQLVHTLLWLFWLLLLARLVLGYVQMFARDWRPRGALLVLAEGVYTLTDPPLLALRKVLPPLRLGQVSLDLSYLALFVLVGLGMNLTA